MKEDLIRLMPEKKTDALWILGPANHNAAMRYFTGPAHLTHAELFIKQGQEPILFHQAMERDEAARTGLETRNLGQYQLVKLIEEADGDVVLARARLYQKLLQELDLDKARIALYGKLELGSVWGVLKKLETLLPDLKLIGEGMNSMLLQARATKDQVEVDRIREMGRVTTEVVGKVARYLQSREVDQDQILLKTNGNPLTVGDVKSQINLWLSERGVENPEGVIFALGRDAGIPHSAGTAEDQLKLGESIVFDIFPCESGGGYFYDFTRTWCLGFAPKSVQTLYHHVLEVYRTVMEEITLDQLASELQDRTCELFEERDHPTVRQDPEIKQGYVHSLGHGLGLNVHERPWFGKGATEEDRLAAGTIVTIEPGLYYPDQQMGCRLENTVWMRPDGVPEVLVDYPLDLVLPMENWSPG